MLLRKPTGPDGIDRTSPPSRPQGAQAVRTTWLYVSAITSTPVAEMVIP